jgi:hypothetical protein
VRPVPFAVARAISFYVWSRLGSGDWRCALDVFYRRISPIAKPSAFKQPQRERTGIGGPDQSGRSAEPLACAGPMRRRFRPIAAHRHATPAPCVALLTSRNHRVQDGPSHLRTRVKSFWQARSPIASAIGNSSALGLRQRRLACQRNARCPSPSFSPPSPGGAIAIC